MILTNMKNKIKLTEKYIKESGIELDIKTIPEDCRYVKRMSTNMMDVVIDETDERVCNGWISTIDLDSDGEIVLPEAIDIKRFEKNPVVLYNHNLDTLPIGKCVALSQHPEGILSKTVFATTAFAQDVYRLVKDKILNTFSIGYIPLKKVLSTSTEGKTIVKTLQERYPNRFNDISKLKNIVTEAIMYEYSVVNVPANEEALILAVKSMSKETQDVIIYHKNINNASILIIPPVKKELIKIIGHEDIKIIGHDNTELINKMIRGK